MVKRVFIARIGTGYRIVVPTHTRESWGLRPGDYLVLEVIAKGRTFEESLYEFMKGEEHVGRSQQILRAEKG